MDRCALIILHDCLAAGPESSYEADAGAGLVQAMVNGPGEPAESRIDPNPGCAVSKNRGDF